MAIRDVLLTVIQRYREATTQSFAGHALASYLRNDARAAIEASLGEHDSGLRVVGSAGAGNWATVPWVAVFDSLVTETATKGYYVVYLFHSSAPVVHLSLNQGTTAVRQEFGGDARDIMRDRANLMRHRIADLATASMVKSIELGSSQELPRDYEAGHALGFTYELDRMPSEITLRSDLQEIVRVYRSLTFRAGLDPNPEELSGEGPSAATVTESRRYRLHRRIERNPSARKLAKKHHGNQCQACGFDFAINYGSIGEGFIEVHHLRPLSSLQEGAVVTYDAATDFAVLCSNCHRMIHRWPDPADLNSFRAALVSRVTAPH